MRPASRPKMSIPNPFCYFKTSPEMIRLAVMLCLRFPLSLRNVEGLLQGRGIGVSHETMRIWWNRFGPMFAPEIRRKRIAQVGVRRHATMSFVVAAFRVVQQFSTPQILDVSGAYHR